jgi:hypothetical protein
MTPRPLLQLGPLARDATPDEVTAHDTRAAELARHKLGKITADDADGYHRVMCPAAMGKIRCPLRPQSMTLTRDRPEILAPPEHPPACCAQQTITVPPDIHPKTAQKHDYPSRAHRRSYNRRTGAERAFATIKDPASNDTSRGWCRLMGLTPLLLITACLLTVRNQRIIAAWDTRQDDNARRAATGLPPKTPASPPQARPPNTKATRARATPDRPRLHEDQPMLPPNNPPAAQPAPANPASTPNGRRRMPDPDTNITPGPNVNKAPTQT